MPLSTRKIAPAVAAVLGLLALAACGGGGGGAASPGATPVEGEPTTLRPLTLPKEYSGSSGSFTVPAGQSVDRGGVRFSCDAGNAACVVTVDAEAGEVRVTGDRPTESLKLTVGPVPPMLVLTEMPNWPIADASAARSLMGGSALSWSSDDLHGRIKVLADRNSALGGGGPFALGQGSSGDIRGQITCIISRLCTGDYEDQSIMTYRDIPIVQSRHRLSRHRLPGTTPTNIEFGLVGILDNGFFAVGLNDDEGDEEGRKGIQGVFLHDEDGPGGRAELRILSTTNPAQFAAWSGHWRGALVGTGNREASSLYRQFIIGDVDISTEVVSILERSSTVEFSNIRNINTGESVTLSHMRWDLDGCCRKVGNSIRHDRPGNIIMHFTRPNGNEVLGAFRTEEAVGAFGAKRQ